MTVSEERLREIVRDELDKLPPKSPDVGRRLYDYHAAAAYLSIGKRGVETLAAAGELVKITNITNKVLFDKADLDAFIDRKKAAVM